jgi:hypothetical protein
MFYLQRTAYMPRHQQKRLFLLRRALEGLWRRDRPYLLRMHILLGTDSVLGMMNQGRNNILQYISHYRR